MVEVIRHRVKVVLGTIVLSIALEVRILLLPILNNFTVEVVLPVHRRHELMILSQAFIRGCKELLRFLEDRFPAYVDIIVFIRLFELLSNACVRKVFCKLLLDALDRVSRLSEIERGTSQTEAFLSRI